MTNSVGNFDDFSEAYGSTLSSALGMFGGENSYYTNRKVEIFANKTNNPDSARILDFGCGVGLLANVLIQMYPKAEVWGTDVSLESIKVAKTNNPSMLVAIDDELPIGYFDFVVISNVLHHISPASRSDTYLRLATLLRSGGSIVIFEHNRLNPITRKIVDRCEFDVGVELLSRGSCIRALNDSGLGSEVKSGYFLFFPPVLKKLRHLECLLSKLPGGAQFWITAKKSDIQQ